MKLTVITNIPAPYRIPIFNKIAGKLGKNFLVIFCARLEPNRKWDLGPLEFNHIYLKESIIKKQGYFIHNNPDVVNVLREFKPDVVVTSGFNPTHLIAWAYTLFSKSKHVSMTDGWLHSEKGLSVFHRIVRKIVFWTSSAFIGAGKASLELYRSYGINDCHLFQSHLCIDNDKFKKFGLNQNRTYDLMYSGQIVSGKIPEFFIKVVERVRSLKSSVSVLIIGDGPQKDIFLSSLKALDVDVTYAGFVAQSNLPEYYSKANILLFTTINDAWGIVANEALASGTPVITTPFAGVAHDLVIDGFNGYILGLDPELWTSRIIELLENPELLEKMRSNALNSVSEFNFDNAADGIISAACYAVADKKLYQDQR
ncbi:MAG: glycosyltransferase family 4 protein [Desulfuromonadales bacterium]